MNYQNTLSTTEARKKIFELTKEVQKPGAFFTLTENGRPKAVLMSVEEFESWAETLEVLRDFPDLDKDLAQTDEAVRIGAYKKWSTLEHLKLDWGVAVADNTNKKYDSSNKNKTKRKKKS